MSLERRVIALVVLEGLLSKVQGGISCPAAYTQHQGSCYKASGTKLSWLNANRDCVTEGGYLVTISNSIENDFVSRIIPKSPSIIRWIGLRRLRNETQFTWSNGTIQGQVGYNYSNWKKGNPGPGGTGKDSCVALEHSTWQTFGCNRLQKFVCETDATVLPTISTTLSAQSSTTGSSVAPRSPHARTTVGRKRSTSEKPTTEHRLTSTQRLLSSQVSSSGAITSEPNSGSAGSEITDGYASLPTDFGITDGYGSLPTDFETDKLVTSSQEPLTSTTQNGQRGDNSKNQNGDKGSVAAIAGGVIGGILLVLAIAVLVYVSHRCRRTKIRLESESPTNPQVTFSNSAYLMTTDGSSDYEAVTSKSPDPVYHELEVAKTAEPHRRSSDNPLYDKTTSIKVGQTKASENPLYE